MNSKITNSIALLALTLVPLSSYAQKEASIWLTNPDRSALFQLQSPPTPFTNSPATNVIAWMVTVIIIGLNGYLLVQTFQKWLNGAAD